MEEKSGAQISKRAFVQALLILFVLMMVAGILTRVVPAGLYDRVEVDGRDMIVADSFRFTDRPDYPIWRWFTAPVEVLWSGDSVTVIVIIIFLLFIGGAFAVLEKSGIVRALLGRIVRRFGGRKYVLLLVVSLFFMLIGAFFGIFEEVLPLVPVMIALSYSLGWDAFVGLGMSILATNMGFSAAVINPFTIGVAQELARLPRFSGAGLRLCIFAVVYVIFAFFLTGYARRIDRNPQASPLFGEDQAEREKYKKMDLSQAIDESPQLNRALAWFAGCLLLVLALLVTGAFVEKVSDISLPLVGVLFLAGGVGAGFLSGVGKKTVGRGLLEGITGILPGIPLILMAVSVKHIIQSGGILDTILHSASAPFMNASPLAAVLAMFALALGIEFFVSSGSAKAFLMMPILLPLADLIGVTRQTTVLAYCFGDGFTNLAYPTSAVLLISLGLASVSYPRWLRWTLPLWGWILLAALGFMGIAVAIHFGPF